MKKNIQSIRGMNDYLPDDMIFWQNLEDILKNILFSYGYNEIRLPIVEKTSLFKRAIGQLTDIIEKEMYSFEDRNGDNITLRPEGTAGCVRSLIEHDLLYTKEQRLWYIGPMFRHERPQKGRYRQFYQLGVEVFGQKGPDIDAELIMIAVRMWKALGINNYLTLEINSIGSLEARIRYRQVLIDFLTRKLKFLNKDFIHKIYTNTMRILDTKNIHIQEILHDAPKFSDYLDDESNDHFSGLLNFLDLSGILYTVNPRLMRGLDYYNRTIFEWVNSSNGTICAGGRYDSLVEQLGGRVTSSIGFAIGLERLMLLLKDINHNFFSEKSRIDAYFIYSENVQNVAIQLAEQIRNILPKLRLMTNYGNYNFKKQFSRANKYSARIVLMLGKNEVQSQQIIIKNLITGNQEKILQKDIFSRLTSIFSLKKK